MELTFRMGKLSLSVRLIVFAALELIGVAIQLTLLGSGAGFFTSFLPGAVPMIAGLLPLRARKYTNKPEDLGFEDWQPASDTEVRRIAANFRLTREAEFPVYFKPVFGIAIAVLLLIVAFFVGAAAESRVGAILVLDALIMLTPFLFFGAVDLFIPTELKMKLDTFQPILEAKRPEPIILTPYLRLDKDREGRRIPEDIRFMLEPRRKADDLLGAQVQIAVNKGPKGTVPYMYAVFITRGAGKSYSRLSEFNFRGFIVEKKVEGEYGTIVVRQKTSGDGYYTDPGDCLRLHDTVVQALVSLPA